MYEHPSEATRERYCWQTEEINGYDRSIVAIGVYPRRHLEATPRVLLVEQTKSGQLVFHVAARIKEAIVEDMASKPFISRNKLFYTTARRVVQLEYQLLETIQTEAALLVWTSEQQEDYLLTHINAILYFCKHTDSYRDWFDLYTVPEPQLCYMDEFKGQRKIQWLNEFIQGSKKRIRAIRQTFTDAIFEHSKGIKCAH